MKLILSILIIHTIFSAQKHKLSNLAIDKHVYHISNDTSYKETNWKPLIKVLENKKVVSLGEFNHGNKEVFFTRNDLIKQLHKKLGFNLILFESGLGELHVINENISTLNGRSLTNGFFGVGVLKIL